MWEFKFKRKPKPEVFEEKQAYVPQTQEHSPSFTTRLTDYGNHVTRLFNDYCTEMGVQCSISIDPADCYRTLSFKVVGNRDVKIEYRGEVHYLAPGEGRIFKLDSSFEHEQMLPKLTLLPYGNAADQQNVGMQGSPAEANISGWNSYQVHREMKIPAGVNRDYWPYNYPTS
jgi:hypothetical protein